MIHRTLWTAVLGLAVVAGFATPAEAEPFSISFGPSSSNTAGIDFSFNLVVPTTISGDATLVLTLDGDFDASNEHAEILLDTLNLGKVANGDTSDDNFDFANGDNPDSSSDAGSPFTGTVIISGSDLASLIADGFLNLMIKTSRRVDGSTTTVSGMLSFEYGTATATSSSSIPEPTTLALLGAGLLLLRLRRRR